ncbi:hypothetical protein G3M55_12625, partial [Streptomyces sp. SID8455]|nr:hypothetical protein [Streptomyces sp. SID8455]
MPATPAPGPGAPTPATNSAPTAGTRTPQGTAPAEPEPIEQGAEQGITPAPAAPEPITTDPADNAPNSAWNQRSYIGDPM